MHMEMKFQSKKNCHCIYPILIARKHSLNNHADHKLFYKMFFFIIKLIKIIKAVCTLLKVSFYLKWVYSMYAAMIKEAT